MSNKINEKQEIRIYAKVLKKLENELDKYEKRLSLSDKKEILLNSYEYIIKKEICEIFDDDYYNDMKILDFEDIEKLSEVNAPLQFLYDKWVKSNFSINSKVTEFLENIKSIS